LLSNIREFESRDVQQWQVQAVLKQLNNYVLHNSLNASKLLELALDA
jgi:hypothetical protein